MNASSSRWVLVAFSLLASVTARADPPTVAPSEEQVEVARGMYKEARELQRQGRTKEALDKALEAYRTAATPVTALEAGQLLIDSSRFVEARDILRAVAMMAVSPRESDRGREARQQASTLAASLDARIPKLAVSGAPRGVEILLDGRPLPPTDPAAWQGLDPRPHTLVVRTEERTCSTITVTLAEGEVRTVDLHDAASSCRIESPPVEADRSAPPLRAPPVREKSQPPPPERSASTWKWAGLAMGGVGVAAVAIGGYIALSAKSDYDSVNCPNNLCMLDAYNVRIRARSRADAATITMSIGGAAAVGGVLLWLLLPDPAGVGASSNPGRVHLEIGLGTVALRARFR